MTQMPDGHSSGSASPDLGASPDLDALRRWEDAGGQWHLVAHNESSVRIALCRCDGGEEVQRITSREPALMRYVANVAG